MTVKEYNDRPEARVFRLDTECYIVYLGDNGNDYKPFLRIGNTPDLPQPIIANTQNIVITDRLTGNPALESANIYDMYLDEIRYLGDPDLVEHFRTYVKKANLNVQAFDEYTGVEESSANASYVYFYTDGNMSVYFGRTKVFNLRDRERRDVHFIERAKRIRSQYIKNQLRYREEDFRAPGFFLLEGNANFFQDGKIIVPDLSQRFFSAFADAGIDPDQIGIVLADSLTESVIDLFKRKRSKQDQVVILTANPELVSTAAELFSIKKQDSLDAKVMDFTGQKADLEDVSVERQDGRLIVKFKGSSLVLVSGAGSAASLPAGDESSTLAIDPASSEVVYQRGRRTFRVTVLAGTPHTVQTHVTEPAALYHRYFDSCFPFYVALLPPELNQLVAAINAAVGELLQGKEGASLKQLDSRFRELSDPIHPYVRNYLITAESMLRMIHNGEGGLTPVRSAGVAATSLSRLIASAERTESSMAFVGEVTLGAGGVYLFYRPVKTNVTPNQVETAQVQRRKIVEESEVDRSAFSSERERLLDLISQLNIPQTRRTPGPAEAAKVAEREAESRSQATLADRESETGKGVAAPSVSEKKQSSRETPTSQRSGAQDGIAAYEGIPSAGTSTLTGSPERERGRWRLPVAIAAILIVIAGVLWFVVARGGRNEGAAGAVAAGGNQGAAASSTAAPSGSGDTANGGNQNATNQGNGANSDTGGSGAVTDSGSSAGSAGTGGAAGSNNAPGPNNTTGSNNASGTSGQQASGTQATGTGAAEAATATAGQQIPGSQGTAGLLRIRGVQITIADLIRLTNRIATANGFRPMGIVNPQIGPDPDWIYPGNVFALPDGSTHLVVKSDTIWYIAADYIRRKLESALTKYEGLLAEYGVVNKIGPSDPQKRQELVDQLKRLEEGVFSENFTRMIRGMIVELEA